MREAAAVLRRVLEAVESGDLVADGPLGSTVPDKAAASTWVAIEQMRAVCRRAVVGPPVRWPRRAA